MPSPNQLASTSASLPFRLVEVVVLLKENVNPPNSSANGNHIIEFLPKSFADQGVLKNIHLFCFPGANGKCESLSGTGIESWLYHNFVLTVQNGARLYCHCLRYPDPFSSRLTLRFKNQQGEPMALCVVSKRCYYNTMKHLLVHVLTGLFLDIGM